MPRARGLSLRPQPPACVTAGSCGSQASRRDVEVAVQDGCPLRSHSTWPHPARSPQHHSWLQPPSSVQPRGPWTGLYPVPPPHPRARNTEQPTGSRASCRTFAGQLNKHLLFIHQRQIKSFLGDWNCLFRSCTLGPSPPTLLREPFPLYLVLWGQHGAWGQADVATPTSQHSGEERKGGSRGKDRDGVGKCPA